MITTRDSIYRLLRSKAGQFYVYRLSRPNGESFYIGYGEAKERGGQRVFHHETVARNGRRGGNKHKNNTIRSIIGSGGHVLADIDSFFHSEDAAKTREVFLIAQIGRRDLGTGPLVNMTDGGDGPVNLSGDSKERLHAGQKRGFEKAAQWRLNNPDILRATGARLGQLQAMRAKTDPEQYRLQCSAAGKIGIKVTLDRLRNDPEQLALMAASMALRNRTFAKENPALASSIGKLGYAAGLGKIREETPHKAYEASQRGGLTNVNRWKSDPEYHKNILRLAADGVRRRWLEEPELKRQQMSRVGSRNKIKAAIRARCLDLIRLHDLNVVLPSGRAGIAPWKAALASIESGRL